jgi:hypothetical protein
VPRRNRQFPEQVAWSGTNHPPQPRSRGDFDVKPGIGGDVDIEPVDTPEKRFPDSERLDWLEENLARAEYLVMGRGARFVVADRNGITSSELTLRDAIDALMEIQNRNARKAQEPQDGDEPELADTEEESKPLPAFKRGDRVSFRIPPRGRVQIGTIVTSPVRPPRREGCESILVDGTKQATTIHRKYLTLIETPEPAASDASSGK